MRRIVLVLVLLLAMMGIVVRAASSTQTYLPITYQAPSTPTPTPTPSPTIDPFPILLPNGDFEQGREVWKESSDSDNPLIYYIDDLVVQPFNGSWAAWFGGILNENESIWQFVLVPADHPYMSYWHWIVSEDICGTDLASVEVNAVMIDSYYLCEDNNTDGWVQKVYDLRVYSGQTVEVKIGASNNSTIPSSLFVDYFTFQTQP
jgi:hypothetical protein